MIKRSKLNFSKQIIYLGVLTVLGALIGLLLSSLMLSLTGSSVENKNVLLFVQAISTSSIFLLPSILVFYIFKEDFEWNFLSEEINYLSVLFVLALITFIRPAISWVDSLFSFNIDAFSEIVIYLRETADNINRQVVELAYSENIFQLLFRMFVIALLPAVAEELFFRGALQNILVKHSSNKHIAIIVASLVFAIIHMNIVNFIAIFLLGITLGYIYYFTENILYPIIAHFVNNGSLLLMMYQNKDITYGESSDVSLSILVISILVSSISLYYLSRIWKSKNS